MTHCAQCRADACGLVGEDNSDKDNALLKRIATTSPTTGEERPHVAVATQEGLLVNQHLGEAAALSIFTRGNSGWEMMSLRCTPPAGLGSKRWLDLADLLKDCSALLVSGIGPSPLKILTESGLRVVEMEGLIEEGLEVIRRGAELPHHLKRRFAGCGAACNGSGQGCA